MSPLLEPTPPDALGVRAPSAVATHPPLEVTEGELVVLLIALGRDAVAHPEGHDATSVRELGARLLTALPLDQQVRVRSAIRAATTARLAIDTVGRAAHVRGDQ